MLLAVETGFVLRNAAQSVDLRVSAEDAEALRRGEVVPEALVARSGHLHPPPPVAVSVAFSPEALRLSGRMGAGEVTRRVAQVAPKAGQQAALLRLTWIGAGCLALLVLVLIWT